MAKVCINDAMNNISLFSGISAQEKSALSQISKIHHIPRGSILFMQGDEMKLFHVVYSGMLQIFKETLDGHEITSDIAVPGDPLSLAEITDIEPIHKASARAIEDTILIEIPMDWLRHNLKNFNHLMLKLFTRISHRLQKIDMEIERNSTMSASELITCFLHELCVVHDFDPRGFNLPYSKTLIASRLGMELETFSRSLRKLREFGITVRGSHVSLFPNYLSNAEIIHGDNDNDKLPQKMLDMDLIAD
jgi:CRP-like cAMP-binding protein